MRKICIAYWLLLTLLLWSRDPLGWFETPSADALHDRLEPIAHFLSFGLLALFVLCTRWPPVSRYRLLVILAGYSVVTEVVQSQIPGRSMQLVDLLQDFAGIAAGCAMFLLARRWGGLSQSPPAEQLSDAPHRPRRRGELPLVPEPAGDSNS
jgi:VanZ family protein